MWPKQRAQEREGEKEQIHTTAQVRVVLGLQIPREKVAVLQEGTCGQIWGVGCPVPKFPSVTMKSAYALGVCLPRFGAGQLSRLSDLDKVSHPGVSAMGVVSPAPAASLVLLLNS